MCDSYDVIIKTWCILHAWSIKPVCVTRNIDKNSERYPWKYYKQCALSCTSNEKTFCYTYNVFYLRDHFLLNIIRGAKHTLCFSQTFATNIYTILVVDIDKQLLHVGCLVCVKFAKRRLRQCLIMCPMTVIRELGNPGTRAKAALSALTRGPASISVM